MEKIKLFFNSEKGIDVLIALIVILSIIGAFYVGRLSKSLEAESNIKIDLSALGSNSLESYKGLRNADYLDSSNNAQIDSITQRKSFFASNKGSKYYSVDCNGGKTIKPENRVYFATREEAESAGYEISSSCK